MTPAKRLIDIALALLLGVILSPVLVGLAVAILLTDGRPVFYISERMKAPDQPFCLYKLRTMAMAEDDSGVSGGDKAARVTRIGRFLRKIRGDEIPQLWNILRGDMSFVGPRPPLRQYVERFPALYAQVLRSRPGVTGLASLLYHRHEEALLSRCASSEETDAVYARACVPRKARLDLIYQRHRTICFDLWIMWRTFAGVLRR